MFRLKHYLPVSLCSVLLVLTMPAYPNVGQDQGGRFLKTPLGDVAYEVVGRVTNPTPATSRQYGFVSLINGLSPSQIFTTTTPSGQNETSALFTFFSEAVTERVIVNGRLRIVNRVGTTTIFFDDTPDGDFANPDTFRDGRPIVVMAYRQQVILDAEGGTFDVMNLMTVISSESFSLGNETFRLGKDRDQFRVHYNGAPPPIGSTANGVFAGFAVAIEKAHPSSEND